MTDYQIDLGTCVLSSSYFSDQSAILTSWFNVFIFVAMSAAQ